MKSFKIGDEVECLPGFNDEGNYNKNNGGAGWKENKIFKITSISEGSNGTESNVAWTGSKGVFFQALKLKNQTYEIY